MSDEEELQRLIKQMGSSDNQVALAAVVLLREKGWLKDGSLNFAIMNSAALNNAPLSGAVLFNAFLSDSHMLSADLRDAQLDRSDLGGANLSGSNLDRAVLVRSRIYKACLDNASLLNARLNEADLRRASAVGAVFREADLRGAHLNSTNLSEADLRGAKLGSAFLTNATLRGADLTGASCGGTVFANVDLSTVKGLENIRHVGPSTVGIDTLYKSQGMIPEIFLQGCGVPDNLIENLPSLLNQAILFYSCFISYSHHDDEFTKRLYSRLRDANLRVWYAPEDIQGGKKTHEQIYHAIEYHDKLLLVLSEHSIRSEWVMTEIRRARKLEKEQNRRKLFPIRLTSFETLRDWECFDADTGKDLAIEVREYFVPDFTQWKDHDAFETSVQRLLRDFEAADIDQ